MLWKPRLLLALLGLSVVGLLIPPNASAGTVYSYNYVAGQNSYNVAPGSNVPVSVYLQEVNSDQSTNSLLAKEHGLSAAGLKVSFFSGAAGTSITAATANTGKVPNGFDDPASTGIVNSITLATITESTDPPPFGADTVGVEPGTQINGVSEVYLGTFTIHASSIAGQTTIFTVGLADPNDGNTFTNDSNYDLDNNGDPLNPSGASSIYFSAASTNFSITTSVPEPGALSLLAASSVMLLRRRRQFAGCERC